MSEFADIMVIYPSEDDVEAGLWVAHSVRTDQVGVGHDPIEAIRALAFAVRTLLDEAKSDPLVRIEQPAPIEILERMRTAHELPEAMWASVRSAIRSCQRHNSDYWSDVRADVDWEDEAATYIGRIEQQDLYAA